MPSTCYQKINAHRYRHIWAVGGIRGDYQLLQSRLHQLSFCPETGLLISVDGSIDHKPKNLNVLHLSSQPWFISVKGSHEATVPDAPETGGRNMWLTSGGDRPFDLNDSEQQEAIDLLLKFHHLSHIIETTNDTIKYATAHADYPGKECQFGKEIAESELLRPVDHVQRPLSSELQKINGADLFIFGHIMFDSIQTFANRIYIDAGSPKSGRLPFYEIK